MASEVLDHFLYIESNSFGARKITDHLEVAPPDVPVKVELSEPGISFSDIYSYLHSWLGNETLISPAKTEIVPDAKPGDPPAKPQYRPHCAARPCAGRPVRRRGPISMALVSSTADCIYSYVEPYRYASYIGLLAKGKI